LFIYIKLVYVIIMNLDIYFRSFQCHSQKIEGDVKIHNYDIDKLDIYKQGITMGMCPQHNTIWEYLTVDQSLWHVGEVKGLSY
jgi:ABC-type multidrug transport system ATPase subunit